MRLIDADALVSMLRNGILEPGERATPFNAGIAFAESMVSFAPTIDAVPVVRCKDCKYYHQTFCEIWSKYGTIQTREQGFCYMAERRDDD